MKGLLLSLGLLLGTSGDLLAAIEGQVKTAGGKAVEHARVEVPETGERVFTDSRGRFALEKAVPPLRLLVSHPRFLDQEVEVEEMPDSPLEVLLEPKQVHYEEIVVSANRGEEHFSPVAVASTVIRPEERPAPPSTLTELVQEVPGVAENGQGGIFQVYSVRGVSKHRILNLISGMRITTERRAGVSTSFVDPLLMGSVDVLRGPSSTFYGSGALGGVVQVFPRRPEAWSVEGGYLSQGKENYQFLGWGDGTWSVGVARRQAQDARAADGTRLHSQFSQVSAAVSGSWEVRSYRYELLLLPAAARNIGKASTDFPDRRTDYPEENHLLVKLGVQAPDGWRLEVYAHPNDLETDVRRGNRQRNRVLNRSFDFGLNWQKELRRGADFSARLGVDYFGRRKVDAEETEERLVGGLPGPILRFETLEDAQEDEAGIYGALEWGWGPATILAGSRFAWQRQANGDEASLDDSAWTGFAGLVLPLGKSVELAANLGTGLRFPNLSERFFTGTTGRGGVVSNPDLEPERSVSFDLGLRWYGERLYLAGYAFRNRIEDYVERVEIAPDVLTFINLTSGTIQGLELEGAFAVNRHWNLFWGGHTLRGRDDDDLPLADIPADRLHLGARVRHGPWAYEVRWQHRFAKDDPGAEEKPIPSANLLSASVTFEVRSGLSLTLKGSNLLDEEYFNSADEKVPLAPGRSVGLGVRWSP